MECIFCKIVRKEINAHILFEDEKVMVFNDLNPQAPTHALIIPKEHIASINELNDKQTDLAGHMIVTAKNVAEKQNLSNNGYRLVFNVNEQGGQQVYHIHLHLLGGRQMTWPPG